MFDLQNYPIQLFDEVGTLTTVISYKQFLFIYFVCYRNCQRERKITSCLLKYGSPPTRTEL